MRTIIQIGSHIGNTHNDPIFGDVNEKDALYLVEPVPYLFNALLENYSKKLSNTSNVVFLNMAVSDFDGETDITIPSMRNNFTTLPWWATQLASLNPTHIDHELPQMLTDIIKVKTITLDSIISKYNITNIDLLHTDTEGHDYTILNSYSFKIKPHRIMFEHKHMDGPGKCGEKYVKLCNKLMSMGYILHKRYGEDTEFILNN